MSQGRKEDFDDVVTMGLALSNDGKPVPSRASSLCGLIPKGAKNVAAAKEFLKYLIQPKVCNEYLKTGLGRRLPAMPVIAKDDPWWLDPSDPHRVAYTTQGLLGPTVPEFSDLQSGVCAGSERACLADRLGRDHEGWDGAAGGGGEGVQADRGNLRQISDRVGPTRNARARGHNKSVGSVDREGGLPRRADTPLSGTSARFLLDGLRAALVDCYCRVIPVR